MEAARQKTVLRLVVASPGDVQTERELVEEVAGELNQGLADYLGLSLEVIRWETDAYPGFHPEGSQALIDELLDIAHSDIVVGIFWKRFGTPVTDARGGTEHELRHAWEAWTKNKRPQVMVYFNKKPYSPTSKADLEQWGAVLDFQSNFPKEGLWWSYRGKAEFRKIFHNHLTQLLKQRAKQQAAQTTQTAPLSDARPTSHIQTLANGITYSNAVKARKNIRALRDYVLKLGSPEAKEIAIACIKDSLFEELDGEQVSASVRQLRQELMAFIVATKTQALGQYFQAGELENMDLFRMNFSGQELHGVSFKNAFLIETDFQGASLDGADFTDACIRNVKFVNAKLRDVNFTNADWFNAIGLTKAQLETAQQATLAPCPGNLTELHSALLQRYSIPFESWTKSIQDELTATWETYAQSAGLCAVVRSWQGN